MKTWRERLDDEDYTIELARGWTTCAVGEQHAKFPDVVLFSDFCAGLGHRPLAIPEDPILDDLGRDFYLAIAACKKEQAHAILTQIEDRVLVLKREAPHGDD